MKEEREDGIPRGLIHPLAFILPPEASCHRRRKPHSKAPLNGQSWRDDRRPRRQVVLPRHVGLAAGPGGAKKSGKRIVTCSASTVRVPVPVSVRLAGHGRF